MKRSSKTSFLTAEMRRTKNIQNTFIKACDCSCSLVNARVVYDGYFSHIKRPQGWDHTVVLEDNRGHEDLAKRNEIIVENENGVFAVNAYFYLLLGRDEPDISSVEMIDRVLCSLEM